MPNGRKRGSSVRSKRSRGSAPRPSLTLSELEEKRLSTRSDLASFRGKQIVSGFSSVAGSGDVVISPSVFGNRLGALLANYARWRIQKLVIKSLTVPEPAGTAGSIGSALTVGVYDDPLLASTTLTQNEILESRCSRVLSISGADSNEFQWNPIDRDLWYSTLSTGDARLYAPCAFVFAGFPTNTNVNFVVYFSVQAEGAYDNTS